jgi:glycosyltransferase involved in cell wall biosynthesis
LSRPRVLWLIKGLARGGAERLVSVMAPQLRDRAIDLEVCYVLAGAGDFVPDLRASGVPVHCLAGTATVELGWPRHLRQLLRSQRYDIVHTHSPVPAVAARLLAPRGTALMHTEHNMWAVYRGPTYAANALTFSRNAQVYAVSAGVADSIVRPRWASVGSMPPVDVLLHGVDVDSAPRGHAARAAARRKLGLTDDDHVIGNVANFSPKKDHRNLLEAFEEVLAVSPDAILLLIGMGPLEHAIRDAVRRRGLDARVRFLGSREDVPELLPALDVFVLSSQYEGLPISLLEAMAAEVACVSTDVGGIPEAIRNDTEGRLVPPQRPDALAQAVVDLLADTRIRVDVSAGGRARVKDAFSLELAISHLARAYVRATR